MIRVTKEAKFRCIDSEGSEDFQEGKVYRVLPDPVAAQHDYLRVVDDSGEDYLYPARRFERVVQPTGEDHAVTE